MKYSFFLMAYFIAIAFSHANQSKLDKPLFNFIDFGVNSTQSLPHVNFSSIKVNLFPELNLGIGKSYQLNHNWSLIGTLSLNYQLANFAIKDHRYDSRNGKYESYGILATGKVLYLGFNDKVSPYLQFDINAGEYQYQIGTNDFQKHGINFKTTAGFEFSLDKDSSASIGIGYTND